MHQTLIDSGLKHFHRCARDDRCAELQHERADVVEESARRGCARRPLRGEFERGPRRPVAQGPRPRLRQVPGEIAAAVHQYHGLFFVAQAYVEVDLFGNALLVRCRQRTRPIAPDSQRLNHFEPAVAEYVVDQRRVDTIREQGTIPGSDTFADNQRRRIADPHLSVPNVRTGISQPPSHCRLPERTTAQRNHRLVGVAGHA